MKNPNKPRRPIDVKRESAGSFSLNEPGSEIESMLVVDHKLIIVSTKGVHQSLLADQVDPERKDFALPKMIQQRLIDYGSTEPFIAQTLLVAKELFDETYLKNVIDPGVALSLSLKAAREYAAAKDILTDLENDQANGIEKLGGAVQGSSFHLPSVPALESRVSAYLNHVRGACLALVGIVQLFYPKRRANDNWRAAFDVGMQGFVKENPAFSDTAKYLPEFIENASNLRNAVEHPDKSKSAAIDNFRIVPGMGVSKPRLKIVFKGKTLIDSEIDHFMRVYLDKAAEVFADMCALLCEANIIGFGPLVTHVGYDQEQPTGIRRYRYHSQFKEGLGPKEPKAD